VQAMIQELQQRLQVAESGMQAKMAEIQADKAKTAEELKLAREKAAAEYKLAVKESRSDFALKVAELRAEMAIENARARTEGKAVEATSFVDMHKAAKEFAQQLETSSLDHSKKIAKAAETIISAAEKVTKKRKAKIKAPSGRVYEVEDE
jgi:hypothetical protein